MRAVRYHEHGGRDVLQVEEIDRPDPNDDELLVEVCAAGINPVDVTFREGTYEPFELPMIPGADAAGVVVAVGESVDGFEAGDRVFATGLGSRHQGTCAEYAAVPTDRVAHLPDGVSFEEGAAAGVAGATAWEALVRIADLVPAEICLVHGGNGGVGHVAVQLASTAGAFVTTTAAPEYHDRLRELGAETVLDYDRDDLAEAIASAGAPNVVLDHRVDEYLGLDSDVGAFGARVVAIANTEPQVAFPNAGVARAKQHALHNFSLLRVSDLGRPLDQLARLLESGKIEVAVARTYGLAEVDDAHRAVSEESYLGKLVVTP